MRVEANAIHPFDRSTIECLWFALRQLTEEKFQQDGALGIGVRDGVEQFTNDDFHAEFLAQLAPETLLEGFTGLAFAAGKFPQPPEMRGGVALGDEQLAGAKDEARADFDDFRAHQRPMLL